MTGDGWIEEFATQGGFTYTMFGSVQVKKRSSPSARLQGVPPKLRMTDMAMLLNGEAVEQLLNEVPEWRLAGDSLERTITCKTFTEAIELVRRAAEAAEAMDHHPDIDIRYCKVRFVLSTHSVKGLTDLDFTLARRLDALAPSVQG